MARSASAVELEGARAGAALRSTPLSILSHSTTPSLSNSVSTDSLARAQSGAPRRQPLGQARLAQMQRSFGLKVEEAQLHEIAMNMSVH